MIKNWRFFAVLSFAVAAAFLTGAGQAWAGDEKATKAGTKAEAEEKAMMEAWMKAATPSEAHKKLEPFVGTWETKVTMWMKPGAPPEESSGISETKWSLDGRFLEQRYTGTFMGQPFSGIGYTGFDNTKKRYIGTWMDTASTSIMYTEGSADASAKKMTFTGTMDDPLTKKPQKFKEVVTVVSDDHHTMEMWGPDPKGKTYKTMEIHYTKKKM